MSKMTDAEIDERWRRSTVEGPEHKHIQRLFAVEQRDPTLQELFAEGASVNCICGERMTSYEEFQRHQESSRGYYRNMLRQRPD